jgi:hypothetical protein
MIRSLLRVYVVMAVVTCSHTAAIGDLVADQQNLDLGGVIAGYSVDKTITLHNTSAIASVRITIIKTSCSCTAAKVDTYLIKPNGTDKVIIQYHAHDDPSPFAADAAIVWREVSAPSKTNVTRIGIQGVVESLVDANTQRIELGVDKSKRTFIGNSTVILTKGTYPAEDFDRLFIEHKAPYLNCALTRKDKLHYNLVVSPIYGEVPIGIRRSDITLKIYDPEGKLLTSDKQVPVLTTATGPYEVEPATLYFGALASTSEGPALLNVVSKSHGLFRVTSVSCVPADLLSVTDERRKRDSCSFHLKLNPQFANTPVVGNVIINIAKDSANPDGLAIYVPFLNTPINPK